MSFIEDLVNNKKIDFVGYAEQHTNSEQVKQRIIEILEELYTKSSTARNLFENNFKQANEILKFVSNEGEGNYGYYGSPNEDYYGELLGLGKRLEVGTDFKQADNFYFINQLGQLIKMTDREAITHELVHTLARKADTYLPEFENPNGIFFGKNQDHAGDVNVITDEILKELGYTHRRPAYYAWFTTDEKFDLGLIGNFSYTEENEVDLPIKFIYGKDFSFLGSPKGNAEIDTSGNTNKLRDLIFSFDGEDNISSGSGNDYLYGGLGDDTLSGGSGNDYMHGGQLKTDPTEDGTDTVSYAISDDNAPTPHGIIVQLGTGILKDKDGASVIEVLNDGHGNQDRLISIERIIGTKYVDTLKVQRWDNDQIQSIDLIDFGENPDNNNVDILDLSWLKSNITILQEGDNILSVHPKGTNDSNSLKVKNFEEIRFGSGNDLYDGNNTSVKFVYLGWGDDTVKSASAGTQFYGGPGNDTFYVLDRTLVADAEANDRIILADGFTLHGGKRNANSESPYAIGTGGIRYGLNKAGELVIEDLSGWQMFVAGAQVGPNTPGALRTAGITLFEFAASAYRLLDLPPGVGRQDWLDNWFVWLDLFLKTTTGKDRRGVDPLILDLDGDGLELSSISSVAPTFDMDLDGFAEPTGWATGGDGFLVLDDNNNGRIDTISELFGSPAQPGFEELKTHDLNNDNRIDTQDTVFNRLRVWVDANNNAVTDPGELKTLQELGIQSLSVQPTPQTKNQVGHYIAAEAAFTRTDGTTGMISDVRFVTDNYNTVYLGDSTVSETVKSLPNVKGKGTLTDLHIAMTQRDAVRQAVIATLPTLTSIDLANLRDAIAPILIAWGGPDLETKPDVPILVRQNIDGTTTVLDFAVMEGGAWRTASGGNLTDSNGNPVIRVSLAELLNQPVAAGTTWRVLDGAIIDFLEKYIGEPLPLAQVQPGNRAAVNAAGRFLELVTDRLNTLAVRLAAQGPLAPLFAGIQYDVVEDAFKPTSDRQLIPMFEAIFSAAKQQSNPLDYIKRWQPTVSTVLADFDRGEDYLQISKAYVFANIVAAYESTGLTQAIKEIAAAFTIPPEDIVVGTGTIEGSNGPDIFYMNAGNQTAKGGLGADVYVFGKNFGQDVIEDQEPPLNHSDDMIRFADIKSTEVTAIRENLDLIITVNATGDSVRIKSQFDGATPSLTGGDLSEDYGVTEIIFADGVVWDAIDIAKAVSRSAPTSDTLIGTPTIDFLDGGAGDDVLTGGDDTDAYRFSRGYGKDTIHDAQTNILVEGPDYVTFGAGLSLTDIIFDRVTNSDDLIIKIRNTDDQLTIQQQFDATYTGPFGKQWLNRVELFTFSDNTFLDWDEVQKTIIREKKTAGDDSIYGFDTEDVLDGGTGNDFLSGGNENDTYLFGKDYGRDTIHENMDNILGGQQDKVIFLQGIKPGDITITRQADSVDLSFLIAGSDSSLTIKDQAAATETGPFGRRWFHRIEEFYFQDAPTVVWTWEDVFRKALSDAKTDGDDTIYGFHYTDTLDGGLGNDRLIGGADSDTYIFGRGYGHDRILDFKENILVDNSDRVIFAPGITLNDLEFSQAGDDGDDLVIRIKDTGDTLTIEKQFERLYIGHDWYAIEEFQFADGTIITSQQVRAWFPKGTPGNDTLIGTDFPDILNGGAGNDRLEGRGGSDTYLFNLGDGNDVIYDFLEYLLWENTDVIQFGAGILPSMVSATRSVIDNANVILTFAGSNDSLTLEKVFEWFTGIEEFHFSDGTVWTLDNLRALMLQATDGNDIIVGFADSETINGKRGNDLLKGERGSDLYLFAPGDGVDVLYDQGNANDIDIIRFAEGINPNEVRINYAVGDAKDLIIKYSATDSVLLDEQINNQFTGIERVEFYDGTVWTKADSLQRAKPVEIIGTDRDDIIQPIFAGATEGVTVDGKLGQDRLVLDYSSFHWSWDRINNLTPGQIRNSNDKILVNYKNVEQFDITGTQSSDHLKAKAGDLLDGQGGKDKLDLDLGNVTANITVDLTKVENQVVGDNITQVKSFETVGTIITGSGNDVVKLSVAGSSEAGAINGGAGIDWLILDYSTYRWSWDRIIAANDGKIVNGNGNILLTYQNFERLNIIGTQANDQIEGGNLDDVFVGNGGSDILKAGLGNDAYQLNAQTAGGSQIQDTGGTDTLVLDNLTLSLTALGIGVAGIKRQNTTLLIDLNRDGIINSNNDLRILDFFSPGGRAGTGFIEQINNLSGTVILNFFDTIPPTSAVKALPTNVTSNEFLVSWVGNDDLNGSAIANFTIYVSENGGAFHPWLENTVLIQATYSGQPGHTYVFYSIARDNAGNLEAAPLSPDAITAVSSTQTSYRPRSDFNGDGKGDLFWHNPLKGTTAVWEMNGTQLLNAATVLMVGEPGWQVQGIADFNGDGKADVFWHNLLTSKTAVWEMNGTQLVKAANVLPVGEPGWQVKGIADFNGDGKADVFWHNLLTGNTAVWEMNGTQLVKAANILTVGEPGWQVQDIADFNGDGKADVFWHNSLTGNTAVWEINGTQLVGGATIHQFSEPGWQAKGIADLNGDGKADVFWHNPLTGNTEAWEMNGTQLVKSATVLPVGEPGWQVEGMADFNGDGKADVFWYNSLTGNTAIWEMNGTQLVNGAIVHQFSEPGWQVQGISDFNSDGKADVFWHNSLTGSTEVWQMNGTQLVQESTVLTVGEPGWQTQHTSGFLNQPQLDLLLNNPLKPQSTRSEILVGATAPEFRI